jgi:hypothetical protein
MHKKLLALSGIHKWQWVGKRNWQKTTATTFHHRHRHRHHHPNHNPTITTIMLFDLLR